MFFRDFSIGEFLEQVEQLHARIKPDEGKYYLVVTPYYQRYAAWCQIHHITTAVHIAHSSRLKAFSGPRYILVWLPWIPSEYQETDFMNLYAESILRRFTWSDENVKNIIKELYDLIRGLRLVRTRLNLN